MPDLKEIVRREEHIERSRWNFAAINPSYKPPEQFHQTQTSYFTSRDDLARFTQLTGQFEDGLFVAELPANGEAVGCTVFGRRRFHYPGNVIFFAYQEGGQDYIYARPPRIEVDENGIRLKSGNTAKLMHQKPLPKE